MGNMLNLDNFEFFGLKKQIMMKKLKLSPNFVDFKQTIIPAGDSFNKEWFFARSIQWILQCETSDLLERGTSATSNEQISERVTNDFLVTSNFCNK